MNIDDPTQKIKVPSPGEESLQNRPDNKVPNRLSAINTSAERVLTGDKLPILMFASEIKEAVLANDNVIVIGETGSGKTTQIPLILREIMNTNEKVVITQPRRIAARSVSRYVAKNVGCRVGDKVGYQVRFEDRTTEGTSINFVTDGILLRKLQNDPLLQEYSTVMVDEAHERSINIDLVLGLLKQAQTQRKQAGLPPLKILVTSATLEKEKFAKYFSDASLIEVPGRTYPVDINYEKRTPYKDDIPRITAQRVKHIFETTTSGDILIFMPGVDFINKTIAELKSSECSSDIEILPLYSQVSPEEQDRIFSPSNRRRVIVSTNIAETSVTVPGVTHVIDSGLIKQIEFNPETGIEALKLREHAKSGCTQRAGRAGRIEPGTCWRLYTEDDFEERDEFQIPEMRRSNISHVILTMKKIGIGDIASFSFIDTPSQNAIQQAIDELQMLGALDDNENITETGKIMAELPLKPSLSRMIIEAQKYNAVRTVCTIAAFLNAPRIFNRPKDKQNEADAAHKKFQDEDSDFLALLNVWKAYKNEKNGKSYREVGQWAHENFLNIRALREVEEVQRQLTSIVTKKGILERNGRAENPEHLGKVLTAGLIGNLMTRQTGRGFKYERLRDNLENIRIHPASVLFHEVPPFIVSASIKTTTRTFANMNQSVNPAWILEVAPHLATEHSSNVYYDPDQDKVIESKIFVLKGTFTNLGDEESVIEGEKAYKVLASYLVKSSNPTVLDQNKGVLEKLRELWNRCGHDQKYFQKSPLITEQDAASFYQEWLALAGITNMATLQAAVEEGEIDLEISLREFITAEQEALVLQDFPETIVLNGQEYQLEYRYGVPRCTHSFTGQELLRFDVIPCLPCGKKITLLYNISLGSIEFISDDGRLQQIQQNFVTRHNGSEWEKWKTEHGDPSATLEAFNLLGKPPTLPGPIQYGTNPKTDEALYAYPALCVDGYAEDRTFSIRYFTDRHEAKRHQDEVATLMNEVQKEERTRPPQHVLDILSDERTARLIVEFAQFCKTKFGIDKTLNVLTETINADFGRVRRQKKLQRELQGIETIRGGRLCTECHRAADLHDFLEATIAYLQGPPLDSDDNGTSETNDSSDNGKNSQTDSTPEGQFQGSLETLMGKWGRKKSS